MKEPRSKSLPPLVVHDVKPPTVLSASLEMRLLMLTKGDESRPYNFASIIFFLDKHLAVLAIFISRLARGCKYAQNERDFYFVVLQYVKRIVAIFAPHECLFCSLKHCFCTAIGMLLKLNVMHLAVQKRVSCSTILMLLWKNIDFFSQEFTPMLPASLLIFSGSPIRHGWFCCHLFGQKTPPRLFLPVDVSFIIFPPNSRRGGVSPLAYSLFYQHFARGSIR